MWLVYSPSQRHGNLKLLAQDLDCQLHSVLAVILSACNQQLILKTVKCQQLTAKPQTGILPRKQWLAPSANALKMSDPRRIPPSMVIGIRPRATGAQIRRASRVDGAPSSWRPPWFEITIPSMPCWIASSTSSGEHTPFSQMGRDVCFLSQGIAVSQSRVGSAAS